MAVASGDCSMAVRKCSSVEDRRFSIPMSPFFSEAPDERCQPPLCRNCRRHSPKGVEEAVELPRITLLRASVNNANPSVRIHQNPKGRRNGKERARSLPMPGYSHSSEIGRIGGSSPQTGEFLLKERVVMGSLLLAFQPLHVAL